MKPRPKLVDRAVEDLLKRFPEIAGPPINLNTLADKLDIQLYERSLDSGLDGLSAVEGIKRSIIVSDEISLARKRFTIAHELGHLLLHADSPINVFKEAVIFYRNEESSKGELWREVEANRFAASLLMPAVLVHESLRSTSYDSLTTTQLESLAKRFGVSTEAIAFRLGNLGYTA